MRQISKTEIIFDDVIVRSVHIQEVEPEIYEVTTEYFDRQDKIVMLARYTMNRSELEAYSKSIGQNYESCSFIPH